jgi:hypothetical protein
MNGLDARNCALRAVLDSEKSLRRSIAAARGYTHIGQEVKAVKDVAFLLWHICVVTRRKALRGCCARDQQLLGA